MIIKLGENTIISATDIQPTEVVLSNPEIEERFTKLAHELKSIAPKANDFLYFTCVMMTAAEAVLLNEKGSLKKNAQGEPITAYWEEKGRSLKWICSDPNIKPYKNANGDIFPEKELLAAYKKWVGKPLCLDHKSSSVDMVRGIIIDTYYDFPRKRIIALCALDKKNYPDLARKVETGYATCVSMGTGVGVAICTDCGTAASTEADFCHCMRNRTRYGEINRDLNPIELSIVVNGADPEAKIRQVIAAVDSIAQYVELKDQELKASSDKSRFQECEEALNKHLGSLAELKQLFKNLKESEEDHQKDHSSLEKAASEEVTLTGLSEKIEIISQKISQLLKFNEVSNMAEKKAFYLGGGGVNEPTPGKVKYEKEDSDSIRNKEDKQMNGQKPFPDTGPVDGMHPGYDSFGESEEERKRRLLRLAEEETRSLRRQAALEKAKEKLLLGKEAFYLGGGGVNEPTPGKVKYEKEDSDSIRTKEDKQMNGQPPFPGVGNVDGLHPSPASVSEKDELKRKEMYRRAKLSGKFIKSAKFDGTPDLGQSCWQIFVDNKLVLTASVKDIAGNFANQLYKSVSTPDFGKELLARVQNEGLEKVASSLKIAQVMDQAPAGNPNVPDMQAKPASPDMDGQSKPTDKGGDGDPSKQIPELLDTLENTAADLHKGFDALTNKSSNELDQLDQLAPNALSPVATAAVRVQKELRGELVKGIKDVVANLHRSIDEIKMAKDIYKEPLKLASINEPVDSVVKESINDAHQYIAQAYRLMGCFVKYHQGAENVMKRVANDLKLYKQAQETHDPLDYKLPEYKGPHYDLTPHAKPTTPVASTPKAKLPSEKTIEELMHERGTLREQTLEDPMKHIVEQGGLTKDPAKPTSLSGPGGVVPEKANAADDECSSDGSSSSSGTGTSVSISVKPGKDSSETMDLKMTPDGSMEGTPEEVGKAMHQMKQAEFDMNTVEGRTAYRAKLAEKSGVKFYKMLETAHGKTGVTPPSISENKPQDDLAKFETLEERHQKMLDALSPKSKKTAEEIQNHIKSGKLTVADVDQLVANGVDKDAVAYWKAMWGQAKDKDCKEFASDLTKEHYEAKLAKEIEAVKVKYARSYELAYDMIRKGALDNSKQAISREVEKLVQMDGVGFSNLNETIKRLASKEVSALPRVGMDNEDFVIPKTHSVEGGLAEEYARMFSTPRRGFKG